MRQSYGWCIVRQEVIRGSVMDPETSRNENLKTCQKENGKGIEKKETHIKKENNPGKKKKKKNKAMEGKKDEKRKRGKRYGTTLLPVDFWLPLALQKTALPAQSNKPNSFLFDLADKQQPNYPSQLSENSSSLLVKFMISIANNVLLYLTL